MSENPLPSEKDTGVRCPGCGSVECQWKRLECESPVTHSVENDAPERKHHPDCPAPHFPDRTDRCRCMFMAMLDRVPRPIPPGESDG